MLRRFAIALCCFALVGCDQFATIGILTPESESAGAPAFPEAGAGETPGRDAATAGSGSAADAGTARDAATECPAIEIPGCNPVTNEGCSAALGMQCAVDFTMPLGGYCIFYSGPPPSLGGACLNTVVTESCAPTSACVGDRCRKLCLCDTHCETGQCCTDPLDGTGFKVCGDC